MIHSPDEARRERADVDRLDLYWRSLPLDGNHAAAMLGLILAERLLGWAPPWRRRPEPEGPAPLVLSLSRVRKGLWRPAFSLLIPMAAND